MSFLQVIGVITLGVIGWGSFIAFMVVTTRENRKARERIRDPYEVRERRAKVTRALAREHIFTTDHKGRERLGIRGGSR